MSLIERAEAAFVLTCGRCKGQSICTEPEGPHDAEEWFMSLGWAVQAQRSRVLCPDCVTDLRSARVLYR